MTEKRMRDGGVAVGEICRNISVHAYTKAEVLAAFTGKQQCQSVFCTTGGKHDSLKKLLQKWNHLKLPEPRGKVRVRSVAKCLLANHFSG